MVQCAHFVEGGQAGVQLRLTRLGSSCLLRARGGFVRPSARDGGVSVGRQFVRSPFIQCEDHSFSVKAWGSRLNRPRDIFLNLGKKQEKAFRPCVSRVVM